MTPVITTAVVTIILIVITSSCSLFAPITLFVTVMV
jgi:hypothetical protein